MKRVAVLGGYLVALLILFIRCTPKDNKPITYNDEVFTRCDTTPATVLAKGLPIHYPASMFTMDSIIGIVDFQASDFFIHLYNEKGQAIGKSQAHVIDGKSKQVTAVAKSDFNIIQKIDANNSKHIKVTTNQVQAPVNSSDKVGTATFEDKSLVGEGYLPNQGMPSMELVAGKEVKKSFFLKVWWNHFVNFVNEKL